MDDGVSWFQKVERPDQKLLSGLKERDGCPWIPTFHSCMEALAKAEHLQTGNITFHDKRPQGNVDISDMNVRLFNLTAPDVLKVLLHS